MRPRRREKLQAAFSTCFKKAETALPVLPPILDSFMRRTIILACSIWMSFTWQMSRANDAIKDDVENRFSEMVSELSGRSEHYSVEFCASHMAYHASSSDIRAMEFVGKKQYLHSKGLMRLDLNTESLNAIASHGWEHVLYTRSTRKVARAVYGRQQLRIVEIPLDKVASGVNWVGSDFVALPVASLYTMSLDSGFDFFSESMRYSLREANRVPDGIEGIFASPDGKRILLVQFGHTPGWAPIRVKQYISQKSKLDRNDKFEAQLEKFLVVSDTVTEWELSPKGEYVPSLCRMATFGPNPKECEVHLNNWKFGEDVIETVFEADSFTVDSLKNFQFDQIKKDLIERREEKKKASGK